MSVAFFVGAVVSALFITGPIGWVVWGAFMAAGIIASIVEG